MRQVSVLLSANFDAAQLDAIRAVHPALVVHGEAGCYATADVAFDHLLGRGDIDPRSVVVAGRSLGAAVAIDLVSRRQGAAGLIAISPFTSMRDMGRRTYPGLPTHLLLRHHFDNLAKLTLLTAARANPAVGATPHEFPFR